MDFYRNVRPQNLLESGFNTLARGYSRRVREINEIKTRRV